VCGLNFEKLKSISINLFGILPLLLILSLGMATSSCIGNGLSGERNQSDSFGNNLPYAPNIPVDPNAGKPKDGSGENIYFTAQSNLDVVVNLGTTITIPVQLNSFEGFEGNITLSIEREELDDMHEANGDVEISLSRSMVYLTIDGSATFDLAINVKASAPSLTSSRIVGGDSGHIHIKAEAVATGLETEFTIPFGINAIYEVGLLDNGSPHTWDISSAPLNFRSHTGGLKLRFINKDPNNVHRIHGNRDIPHQDNSLAAAPAAGQDGGVYEVNIDNGDSQGEIWCHSHESSANSRILNFNMNP